MIIKIKNLQYIVTNAENILYQFYKTGKLLYINPKGNPTSEESTNIKKNSNVRNFDDIIDIHGDCFIDDYKQFHNLPDKTIRSRRRRKLKMSESPSILFKKYKIPLKDLIVAFDRREIKKHCKIEEN